MSDTRKCYFCEAVIEKLWHKRCKACGGRVYETPKTCPLCKEIIDSKALRCPYCHTYFILPVPAKISLAFAIIYIILSIISH